MLPYPQQVVKIVHVQKIVVVVIYNQTQFFKHIIHCKSVHIHPVVLLLHRIYHGETVQTVDCGDKAAAWFSQKLLNKPEGLRLGCFVQSLVPPRTLEGSYDKRHTKVFPKFHSDYMVYYSIQGVPCSWLKM